ncbi:MAG: hypothetical protein HRT94_08290 [Alphaproteobacteria bacterium]|nr:hypothetical protein [Alphaproteobacteria bacterium]
MSKIKKPYDVCVIDIGSPKLGNIGWCFVHTKTYELHTGLNLDEVIPLISSSLQENGLILGLEAPLFVPLREDLMSATKARKGEGRRPWSAGAGAQVLTMNLPIMTYLFKQIKARYPDVQAFVNEDNFEALSGQIMIFEALVSGSDKGQSHMDDAQIMAEYCINFSKNKTLPLSILESEDDTEFFNLTSASLLRCGLLNDIATLNHKSPIYKPSENVL